MKTKRFRIAFSFASEKREFVQTVAGVLAQHFGESRILYDRFHEAELSRSDLAFYLPDLYENEAELVVAVFCADYENREWCGLEWNAIFGLLKKRSTKEVMLTRFDQADGKGLRGLAGYLDLDCLSPHDAATVILERLAINEGKPVSFYAKPNDRNNRVFRTWTPNNLPRLQPFFGRAKELKRIFEALDYDNRTWGALIDGPGGMGKTSLAVRAAYDYPAGQFERIVFLSVKDRELDDEGVRELGEFLIPSLTEMLNELARELDHPEIAAAPDNQRIRMLLEALRSAHVLLILDNLESLSKQDRDKLFTLVKRLPAGCKAILTSRRRIGSGSEELILGQLELRESLAIIESLATHSTLLSRTSYQERVNLHNQTSGNPLLLRWIVGQLGRGSCRTLSEALSFLRSCPSNNDPLEFIFGDLVNEFTKSETDALCALTYFNYAAKVEHICEVAGSGQEYIEPALRSLANRSLVVPDQEERAFALVPMVAEFLRRRRPEVVTETGDRLVARAIDVIEVNGYKNHSCFPAIEAAWPIVSPALQLLLMIDPEKLINVCRALENFFDFSGRWDEWLAFSREAEKRLGDSPRAAVLAYHIGLIHNKWRQPDDMLECAERIYHYVRIAPCGCPIRHLALHLKMLAYELKSDYDSAINIGMELLAVDQRGFSLENRTTAEFAHGILPLPHQGYQYFASIDPVKGQFLNQVAGLHRKKGNLRIAKMLYDEGLAVARRVNDPETISLISGNLASMAIDQGDWSTAEAEGKRALSLSEEIGRKELIALNCMIIAKALAGQNMQSVAVQYAQRALEILSLLDSPAIELAKETLQDCVSKCEASEACTLDCVHSKANCNLSEASEQ